MIFEINRLKIVKLNFILPDSILMKSTHIILKKTD